MVSQEPNKNVNIEKKRFQCNHCDKNYSRKQILNDHIKSKHGESKGESIDATKVAEKITEASGSSSSDQTGQSVISMPDDEEAEVNALVELFEGSQNAEVTDKEMAEALDCIEIFDKMPKTGNPEKLVIEEQLNEDQDTRESAAVASLKHLCQNKLKEETEGSRAREAEGWASWAGKMKVEIEIFRGKEAKLEKKVMELTRMNDENEKLSVEKEKVSVEKEAKLEEKVMELTRMNDENEKLLVEKEKVSVEKDLFTEKTIQRMGAIAKENAIKKRQIDQVPKMIQVLRAKTKENVYLKGELKTKEALMNILKETVKAQEEALSPEHRIPESEEEDALEEEVLDQLQCDQCVFRASDGVNLIRHKTSMHQTGGVRQLKCNKCSKVCQSQDELLEHRIGHATEDQSRPEYECDVCNNWFRTQDELEVHVLCEHNAGEWVVQVSRNRRAINRESNSAGGTQSHASQSRHRLENNETSRSSQRSRKSIKCKRGGSCRFFREGRCFFGHESQESSRSQGQERARNQLFCAFQDKCKKGNACTYRHLSEQGFQLNSRWRRT